MEIWKKMWVGVFFWTQCIIFRVFPALFLFSSSFLAEQVSSLIHGSPYIDKRSAWRPPSCQTCTAERPFPFRHTVFFDQSLEEWINKKSIHRSDVLLPVAFKGHRPSTNHNFIVQLRICLPRRDLLLEQASPDVLTSLHCLRVPECILFKVTHRTVNGSDPVYLSSYFHTSRWRASSNETAIIHIRPTHCFILQPRYCRQAGLNSLRRQSLEQSPCTSHISTVVHGFPAASQEFSLPALLLLNYLTLKVYTLLWT